MTLIQVGEEMEKIKIITDTASDIDISDAKKLDIGLLPLSITFDGKTYKEQFDISKEEYWDVLNSCEEIPQTAQVAPQTFLDEYIKCYEEGYNKFIVVTINGTASGTFNSANLASDMFFEKYPEGAEFKFIDSKLYTALYGKPILDAATLIKNGKNFEEVYEFLSSKIAKMKAYAYMTTLKFAKKSGRISILAAIVGDALGLKPIMQIYDRKVEVISKTRGEKAAISKTVEMVLSDIDNKKEQDIILVHGCNSEEVLKKIEEELNEKVKPRSIIRWKLGGCITTNTGPETIGILFESK